MLSINPVGFGTWQSTPEEVEQAVLEALKAGYTHLDLAKVYKNQKNIANALKQSGVPREKLFITSKLWNNSHRPEHVEAALDDTLSELGLEYLDLYLIHWPVAFVPEGNQAENLFPAGEAKGDVKQVKLDLETTLVDTWKAMIKLKETGKVKHIGVSNFSIEAIEALIKETGVTPEAHQIERHPRLLQKEQVAFCKKHDIMLQAYSPLGNNNEGIPLLIEHPVVKETAKEVDATPAQVLIAWAQVGGHCVLPKSVTPSRIASNLQPIAPLSDANVAKINKIGEDEPKRFNIPFNYRPQWDINVFNDEKEQGASQQVKIQ